MTRFYYIICCIVLLVVRPAVAQQKNQIIKVSYTKTTFIRILGTEPVQNEIGGEDGAIMYDQMQTPQGTFVKLTAANPKGFPTTNMLLVCKDTVLQFDLVFAENLDSTMYTYRYTGGGAHLPAIVKNTAASLSEDSIIHSGDMAVPVSAIQRVYDMERNQNIAVSDNKLIFLLDNIAIDSQYIYFKVRLRNASQVDYNIDYLKFITESQRKKKVLTGRSMVPSQTIYPSYVEAPSNVTVINAKGQHSLIYVLKKFALTSEEQLNIVMKERADNSKGRVVELKVRPTAFNNIVRL